MLAVTPILSILAAAAIFVRADPTPSEPSPGNVYIEGQTCSISWAVDTTGLWTSMDIQLMTGDNFDMVTLTTVGTVDGTKDTTFSYTCPKVTPHSPIYFYQFTTPGSTDKTWTGRFTITDNPKDIVPPSQPTQPNGQQIPWGTGSLVNGTSTSSSASSGSASSPAGSSIPPTGAPPPSTASSTPTITPGSPLLSPAPSVVFVTTSTSTSTSLPNANSAMTTLSISNILSQTVLALGLSALGFVMMF